MRLRSVLVRFLVGALSLVLVLLVACALVFRSPEALFAHSVTAHHITLYCDEPFSQRAGAELLALVQSKLARSPLYAPDETHEVFVCNTTWRRRFFFNRKYRAGGLSYYPLTRNVFIRDGLIGENRIRTTSGERVPGNRTLDYFIAHELTHTLVGRAVGWQRYFRLPVWIREGYADYVGKGGSFDYPQARRRFLSGAREMDPAASGLYLRYHLLVAHYLDNEGWTVRDLLSTAVPQAIAEDVVRNEAREEASPRAHRKQ